MNRIIRWYNKNRKMFWLVIVLSVIIVSLPRILNKYAKRKAENENSSIINTTIYNNENYSIVDEETIKKETNNENTNVISMFIEYCNNKDIERAYDLLSDKCKEKLYPTINQFIDNYYNKIFESRKSYEVQLWISDENSYTYKVELREDILSSGNVNSEAIEDYYTIIKEDNIYKININNYIGSIEINKTNETNELKISVLSKDVFMEYEIYNLKVENKTRNSILVDELESTGTMYLEDKNALHYQAYNHEIVKEELRVKGEKKVSIKFNKKYSTKREIKKIVFSNIILNYDEYKTYTNKADFKDRGNLEIEL